MIFKEWSKSDLDKSIYIQKALKDKTRFELQIEEFEKKGYYTKGFEEDYNLQY